MHPKRKGVQEKLIDFAFLLSLVIGGALLFGSSGAPPAKACGGGGCNPPIRCIWSYMSCITEDVFCLGACTGCAEQPCMCIWERGRCSQPEPGPGPPYFATCDCKVCTEMTYCPASGGES